jgi:hypothetical protein
VAKKWMYIISGMSIVVLAAFSLHWFYLAKPEAFPANEKLLSEINRVFPEAVASTIQDTVFIDHKHVFVPFITEKNEYGYSFWTWNKHKWKVTKIETAGSAVLWKIDNDPKNYHLVWNLHPEDQISYLKFYIVRDRGFHGSGDVNTYIPRFQMDKKVMLEGKTYGVQKVQKEWLSVINHVQKVENSASQQSIFSSIFTVGTFYFGYIAFNEADEESLVMNSVNGRGFGNGDETEFVQHFDEFSLEVSLADPKVYIEKTQTFMEHRLMEIERVMPWIDQNDYGAVYKLHNGPMSKLETFITYLKQAEVPDHFSAAHQKLLSSCENLYKLIENQGYEDVNDEYLGKYKQHYQALKQAFEEWKAVTGIAWNSPNGKETFREERKVFAVI